MFKFTEEDVDKIFNSPKVKVFYDNKPYIIDNSTAVNRINTDADLHRIIFKSFGKYISDKSGVIEFIEENQGKGIVYGITSYCIITKTIFTIHNPNNIDIDVDPIIKQLRSEMYKYVCKENRLWSSKNKVSIAIINEFIKNHRRFTQTLSHSITVNSVSVDAIIYIDSYERIYEDDGTAPVSINHMMF